MESKTSLTQTAASFHGRKQTYQLIINWLLQVLKDLTADFHWLKCCSLSQVNELHVPKQSTTAGSKTFLLKEPRRRSLRTLWPLAFLLSRVRPEPNCSLLHGYGLPEGWAGPNHSTKHTQQGLLHPYLKFFCVLFGLLPTMAASICWWYRHLPFLLHNYLLPSSPNGRCHADHV